MPVPLPSRAWFRALVILFLLGTLVLVGAPYLIRHLIERALLNQGADRVSVTEVDFNPFLGRLRLGGVEIQTEGRHMLTCREASVDMAWLPLFNRHLVVQALTLEGLRLEAVRRDRLLLLGGIPVDTASVSTGSDTTSPRGKTWALGIQRLRLEDSTLVYRGQGPSIHVRLDRLRLQQLIPWLPAQAASLAIEGSINDAPLRLQARLRPFADTAAYEGHLEMEKLGLEPLAGVLRGTLPTFSGKLSLNLDFDAGHHGEGLWLSHQGPIRIDKLHLATKAWSMEEKTMAWRGRGRLEFADMLKIRLQGELRGAGLALQADSPAVTLRHGGLEWEGSLDMDTAGGSPRLGGRGRAIVRSLALAAGDNGLSLGRFEALELKGLSLRKNGGLAIDRIDARGLRLGEWPAGGDTPPMARIKQLSLKGLRYADHALHIGPVEARSMVTTFVRGRKGITNLARIADAVGALGKRKSAAGTGGAAATRPSRLQLTMAGFHLAGDSRLRIIDRFVEPAFTTELQLEKAELSSLDTAAPRRPTAVDIRARSGKYTTLALSGSLTPLLPTPQLDLTVQVKALDLHPLTPYSRDGLGLILKSGSLDMDMRLLSREQRLKGEMDLVLHQFEVESARTENSLQNQIPLPLNVALDALRDRDNVIRLKIPVTGDPARPDFDFGDVLRKALTKALGKGALTYLSYTLQPYGTLVTVARYLGEEISRVRLQAVEFEAGMSTLDEEDSKYLDKLARILDERPRLDIRLCGVATRRDLDKLRGTEAASDAPAPTDEENRLLMELAARRASAVKTYLVEHRGVDASRLAGCQPHLEMKKKAVPRTDLLI